MRRAKKNDTCTQLKTKRRASLSFIPPPPSQGKNFRRHAWSQKARETRKERAEHGFGKRESEMTSRLGFALCGRRRQRQRASASATTASLPFLPFSPPVKKRKTTHSQSTAKTARRNILEGGARRRRKKKRKTGE